MPLTIPTPFTITIAGAALPLTGLIRLTASGASANGINAGCCNCCAGHFTGIELYFVAGTLYSGYSVMGGIKTQTPISSFNVVLPTQGDYWLCQIIPGINEERAECCDFNPTIEIRFDSSGNLQSAYANAQPRGSTGRVIGNLQSQVEYYQGRVASLEAQLANVQALLDVYQGGAGATAEDRNTALLAGLLGQGVATCNEGTPIDAGAWQGQGYNSAVKTGCGC